MHLIWFQHLPLFMSFFFLPLRRPSSQLMTVMDTKAVFAALYSVCEENAAFFSGGDKGPQGEAARRLVAVMRLIQEHARSLEPVISGFASVYHHFDFDPHIPANGYRSLVKVGYGMWKLWVCFLTRWALGFAKPHCLRTSLSISLHHPQPSDFSLFYGHFLWFFS